MKVTKKSILTGKVHTRELDVTKRQLESYEKGEGSLITIFSNLTPSERSFIESGIIEEELETKDK